MDLYAESVENAIFKNTPLVDHVEFYESFENLMANYRKMRIGDKKSASTEYGEWTSGVDILKNMTSTRLLIFKRPSRIKKGHKIDVKYEFSLMA